MSHSQDGAIWLENTEMSQLKGSCKQNILRVQLGELVVVSTFFTVGKKKWNTQKAKRGNVNHGTTRKLVQY